MLDLKNEIIMLDGGMGTMLQAAGVPMGKVPEALNVTHAEAVIDIHRQYIEAGADIIYANTFSANRYKLSCSPPFWRKTAISAFFRKAAAVH